MLSNLHTHTTFSDGKSTPQEMVEAALDAGLVSIGFSDHAYTPYDLRYCMTDTLGYLAEVARLKELYRGQMEIYLGVEEDSRAPVERDRFDYIFGSCHYAGVGASLRPIDSSYEYFKACLAQFDTPYALAEAYYLHFCGYIRSRRPDVIGHFDLPTKFDESEEMRYLSDSAYLSLADRALDEALRAECIFEVNTGLIARGYRTSPCPSDRLLHRILRNGGRVTLSSDAHEAKNLIAHFSEMRARLREIGFRSIEILSGGAWRADPI